MSSKKKQVFSFDKIPLLSKPSESYIKKLKLNSAGSEVRLSKISTPETTSSIHSSLGSYSTDSSSSTSCLRNIFPNNNLRNVYNHLYVQENIADLFLFFTLYNESKMMTHTEFRLFIK